MTPVSIAQDNTLGSWKRRPPFYPTTNVVGRPVESEHQDSKGRLCESTFNCFSVSLIPFTATYRRFGVESANPSRPQGLNRRLASSEMTGLDVTNRMTCRSPHLKTCRNVLIPTFQPRSLPKQSKDRIWRLQSHCANHALRGFCLKRSKRSQLRV